MRRAYFVCLFLCLATALLFSQSRSVPLPRPSVSPASSATPADPKAQARIVESYGKLPLSFEANHGQTDPSVKFLSRTGAYSLFLTGDEAVFTLRGSAKEKSSPQGLKPASLKSASGTAQGVSSPGSIRGASLSKEDGKAGHKTDVLRMKLSGANPAAKVTGVDELTGTSNYFIGNDPAKWRTNVPTYAKVRYEGIYPGIDLVYYGNQRQLEYDFIVAPGAHPRQIAFDVRGAKRIRLDAHGDLIVEIGSREIRWQKPVVYQEKEGARQVVPGRYFLMGGSRVGFKLSKYDEGKTVYIDPLIYSTYLGGDGDDYGYGIAVDGSGNAYVTGTTVSMNNPTAFPTTPGAFQTICGGFCLSNAFVTKLNPTGTALVYSSYLGGSGQDGGSSIAVDGAGNAYVTGFATSTNFPVTPGAIQSTLNGFEAAFVTEVSPSGGALVYSTYLGGNEEDVGDGIAVDSSGAAYVTGLATSTNFPVTTGAFQSTLNGVENAFVSEINPAGSALIYSTYLGGSGRDTGTGIVVDKSGSAYIVGHTDSPNFPVTPGAFQTTLFGFEDPFVTKINPGGTSLAYSTYLNATSCENRFGIAVGGSGSAYVVGGDCGAGSILADKLTAAGSTLAYSARLGLGFGYSVAVDNRGDAFATGYTYVGKKNPHIVAFVAELNSLGASFLDSSSLTVSHGRYDVGYGIAVDEAGSVYIAGYTDSTDFPVTPGAFQTSLKGLYDAFVTKIDLAVATTATLSSAPNPSTYGQAVTFVANVASTLGAPPDGESVTFMKGKTVLGTGTLSGGSAALVISTLKVGTTSVTAVYGGDANFSGSKSNVVKQVVNKGTHQGPYGVVSPMALDFGQVVVGQTSPQKLISLKNIGNSELTVSDISVSGFFALPVNKCAAGVKPGTHCNVYVTFTPHAAETETGTLTFTDNASNSPQTVSLTGTGVNQLPK